MSNDKSYWENRVKYWEQIIEAFEKSDHFNPINTARYEYAKQKLAFAKENLADCSE